MTQAERRPVPLHERFAVPVEEFRVTEWPMHYLLAIAHMHQRNLDFVLAKFDCPVTFWRVLSVLNQEDGKTVGYLAEISVAQRSNMSRVVDAMEKAGLVVREDKEGDRRKRLIFMSEKGRDLLNAVFADVMSYYRRFLAGMSDQECDEFVRLLKKVKQNVGSHLSDTVGW
jgi:DNA-binding MarR family transcriptional regulator